MNEYSRLIERSGYESKFKLEFPKIATQNPRKGGNFAAC